MEAPRARESSSVLVVLDELGPWRLRPHRIILFVIDLAARAVLIWRLGPYMFISLAAAANYGQGTLVRSDELEPAAPAVHIRLLHSHREREEAGARRPRPYR